MRIIPFITFFVLSTSCASAEPLPAPVQDDDFRPVNLDEAALGQLLFYDPILSGNSEVACASCHHPAFGTSDGLSLGIGDGGIGLGTHREVSNANLPEERIPRNSPALFNLGAHEFTAMFHDGRLEVDPSRASGMRTDMGEDMENGFASILSAQAMFPVLSRDEMAGSYNENDIGRLIRQGLITGDEGAWDVLAKRVAHLPDYATRFIEVYPHISEANQIAFTDISNAIARFIEFEWRSDTAPFDAVLAGKRQLTGQAQTGMDLFYGDGNCASCHKGPFLTDHTYHAMGAPQIGPGKSATFEDHHRDDGRFRVTGRLEDRYAFRTPSLRNIALTGPYGHAGAHSDLATFIASHADPATSIFEYDPAQAILPNLGKADQSDIDFSVMNDPEQVSAIAAAVRTPPVSLSDADVAALVAFLATLTDTASLQGRLGIPDQVPSGLDIPNPDPNPN
ncbi:cytochrome-c peroxidase [Pacificibacter marinus]|uniref:cytochrome-c peroxidase n=1 Tax=Pacificibacter marinus TaxID=658057 RepID=UPI001C071C78|nr:cytochrome c peroxidase [Pacificibacter marinus]MBU2865514.1 cytochrome-c peroxidase [Pacificibacter marinus]